jgi:hypothetical protein
VTQSYNISAGGFTNAWCVRPLLRLLASLASRAMGLPCAQRLWGRKVQDLVTARDGRRARVASRPPVGGNSRVDDTRAFFFDPFDPEWSCDSRRKVGVPRSVLRAHTSVFA